MAEFSGAQWCALFPTSRQLGTLADPFRTNVCAFLSALNAARVSVTINATLRPKERAYLMHWAWMIARENYDPAKVPALAGVDIAWLHTNSAGTPDLGASIRGAEAMVLGYDIAFEPALGSRHTEGRAIDMDVSWTGTAEVKGRDGTVYAIADPRNGRNETLWLVGKSYSVIKLAKDAPHWSDDGH